MKHLFRGAFLAAAVFGCAPAFAIGAIAVDHERGRQAGYGYATGYSTREAASAAAVRECRASGNSSCRAVLWFDTCGAYAGSRDRYGTGYGGSERTAIDHAMRECGSAACRLVVSACE